jgi:hypothetical protein
VDDWKDLADNFDFVSRWCRLLKIELVFLWGLFKQVKFEVALMIPSSIAPPNEAHE